MKILITSGLSDKDIGGPAQYGPKLKEKFEELGHKSRLITYTVERYLPIGVRHIFFFLKILPSFMWANKIITLDTFSVGVPSVFATKILNRPLTVRVGGDFLWESYVNRTREQVILSDFYKIPRSFNLKEKIIFYLTEKLLNWANIVAFNTNWQQKIWEQAYGINSNKSKVIRNFIPPKQISSRYQKKNFVWAGRETEIKNSRLLLEVASQTKSDYPEFNLEIIKNTSQIKLLERIKNCYAVINPSLSDVCPNFILEAIAFGKPFIITRETGLREIYDKGGIFVNPLDKDDIILAIKKMMNPDEYSKFKSELGFFNLTRNWHEVARDFLED